VIQNITEKKRNYNPSRFDGDCLKAKKEKNLSLRKFGNLHKDDNSQCLIHYKTRKDAYRKMCLKKIQQQLKLPNDFNHTQDSKSFWDAIKTKNPIQETEINLEDWETHSTEVFL